MNSINFTPDKNFYYLTGIQEDGHLVVLSKYNNIVSEKLFFDRFRFG